MKQETAKRYLDALAQIEIPIQKLNRALSEIDENEERARHKKLLVEFVTCYVEFFDAVCREHPQLDPTKGGGDQWFALRKKYETAEFPATAFSDEDKRSAEKAGLSAAVEIRAELGEGDDA